MKREEMSALAASFAGTAAFVPVAEKVAELVSLWPLQDAMKIKNDVKYGEELQVRITREIAEKTCGEEVTVADAEYIYEGEVEQIPGRPLTVTTALLAANDAYDDMSGFSEDQDFERLLSIAETLGYDWSDEETAALREIVESATRLADAGRSADGDGEGGDAETVTRIAERMALSAAAYSAVCALGENFSVTAQLFVNEFNEIQGLPRVFVDNAQATCFAQLASEVTKGSAEAVAAFAAEYATLAQQECAKHHEDVLWNPDEAKKRAKEEDEAKNKAALAAKFKDVASNDEGKEHVEL